MDMPNKALAAALFALTYILLLGFPKKRAHIALVSAAVFVTLGILPAGKALSAINWNVLLMIAGTMGVVSLFIESKMPALLGDLIIEKTPDIKWAIVSLSLFAGLISAFIDNVATVLIIAPVALTISKKLNISPVLSIIAISLSSNLQGAATLVGDTTSILLGGQAGLDFLDFFVFQGKMGLFWIVQISALTAMLTLLFIFRRQTQATGAVERTAVNDIFPAFLLLGVVVSLIAASFIPAESKPEITNGLICVGLFAAGLTRKLIKTKDIKGIRAALRDIDAFTLLLLAGLFMVVGGVTEAGIVDDISKFFVSASGGSIFAIYTLIVWFSVLLSAVIDNIPYVAAMLPVVAGIAGILDVSPYVLYFGLLTGATLGGNITPIGASANIAALGILRKEGYNVKAAEFMKISVPFTLTAVTAGYMLVWLIWR
ncbi:MAG: SLC13 family permease [Oscillospiraceae bacterium]|nr:SLC13 family permease [Oscillospiraceae bacterium]